MRKLLHERLREIKALGDLTADNGELVELFDKEAQALADEIERYYSPRPRFEDGEVVDWNSDDIAWNDAMQDWYFNAVTQSGVPLAYSYGVSAKMKNGFVVRKEPEVFDADGVEIKVGDVVWRTDPPIHPSNVIGIKHYPEGQPDIVCSEKDGMVIAHYSPSLLTHKEPVLDANGVPIKVGDTVYLPPSSTPHKVEGIDSDGWIIHEGGAMFPHPEHLTHKEPDSLEKLRDDIKASDVVFANCDVPMVREWAERLSALIEIDA